MSRNAHVALSSLSAGRGLAWLAASASTGAVVAIAGPAVVVFICAVPVVLAGFAIPSFGLLATTFVAFVGQPFDAATIRFTPSDVLILLPTAGVAYLYATGVRPLRVGLAVCAIGVFAATAALSAVGAANRLAALLGVLQIVELWLFPALVMRVALPTPVARLQILQVWALGMLVGAASSLIDMTRHASQGDDWFSATRGVAGGFQGYFMATAIVYVVICVLSGRRPFGNRLGLLTWPSLAMYVLALLATQTRGAWIATAVGLIVVLALRQSRPLLLATPVLLIAVLGAAPVFAPFLPAAIVERAGAIIDPDPSTNFAAAQSNKIRIELARLALTFWQSQPLVGIGIKNFRNELEGFTATRLPLAVQMPGLGAVDLDGPHNFPLRVLAEQGLVGLTALGLVGAVLLRSSWRWSRRPDRSDRFVGEFSLAALSVVAVFSLFSELLAAGSLALVVAVLVPAACDS